MAPAHPHACGGTPAYCAVSLLHSTNALDTQRMHVAVSCALCRAMVRNMEEKHAEELRARGVVRQWVHTHAVEVLEPFGGAYQWRLPPRGAALDRAAMRMDDRAFTLDLALALLMARAWDKPTLLASPSLAQAAMREVRCRRFIIRASRR
jgi:hypothetical protein